MMITRRHTLFAGAALGASAAALPSWVRASVPDVAAGAQTPEQRALHALNRLAYGPRPGDMAAIQAQGAEKWLNDFLSSQLAANAPASPTLSAKLADLPTLGESQAALIKRYRDAQQANKRAKEMAKDGKDENAADAKARKELVRPVVIQAATARLTRALQSPNQLEEMLVEFWFNHFNVFAGKGQVSVLVGNYESQAIRPYVFGRFRDMLGATAKHPAMLIYLDNVQSVAPGYQPPSARGRRFAPNPNAPRLTGLNENYARELMELHTLGVDGGYTQSDVTQLARMLTGWTVDYREALRGGFFGSDSGSLFEFDPRRHDQGTKQWLGRTVGPMGQREGEMALDVLATHPATAHHIAFQMAQAFCADQPPDALVKRLADRFLASQGDLRAVTRELIESPEFWSREAYGAKFKTPYQYMLSSLRALDIDPPEVAPLLATLAAAGMPLYGWQTPDGYKNTAAAWMNPEALAQRVQFATQLTKRVRTQPSNLLATLGPMIDTTTRQTIATEPANIQAALVLGSPDFMRR